MYKFILCISLLYITACSKQEVPYTANVAKQQTMLSTENEIMYRIKEASHSHYCGITINYSLHAEVQSYFSELKYHINPRPEYDSTDIEWCD